MSRELYGIFIPGGRDGRDFRSLEYPASFENPSDAQDCANEGKALHPGISYFVRPLRDDEPEFFELKEGKSSAYR